MANTKGVKSNLIAIINGMAAEGTEEFNVFVDEDGDVFVG
jgi:hypothetical protein